MIIPASASGNLYKATVDEPRAALHVAAIYNAAWWVRHYWRGRRASSSQGPQRAQAIQALGLACREAFNQADDYEPLLRALVDSLSPHEPPF